MRLSGLDSHTGGEPTRVILDGFPEIVGETLRDKSLDFSNRFGDLMKGVLVEPRGSDIWVGALITQPESAGAVAGIIFFNNVGLLGMCGHGTIGVVDALRHLGRIGPGKYGFDTPVGRVHAELHEDQSVTVENVASYRYKKDVAVSVPGVGELVGDISYGGNWCFLVKNHGKSLRLSEADSLTRYCSLIKEALLKQSIFGPEGEEVDHIELFGPGEGVGSDSRNFVLCPGNAYDRSPCGTGTSAKLACLFADGELAPSETYVQESITGSQFHCQIQVVDGMVMPTISGRAFVTAESTWIFCDEDPLRWGVGG